MKGTTVLIWNMTNVAFGSDADISRRRSNVDIH
jgi:hypothetical protein